MNNTGWADAITTLYFLTVSPPMLYLIWIKNIVCSLIVFKHLISLLLKKIVLKQNTVGVKQANC